MHEIKLKLTADISDVENGFKQLAKAADDAAQAVKNLRALLPWHWNLIGFVAALPARLYAWHTSTKLSYPEWVPNPFQRFAGGGVVPPRTIGLVNEQCGCPPQAPCDACIPGKPDKAETFYRPPAPVAMDSFKAMMSSRSAIATGHPSHAWLDSMRQRFEKEVVGKHVASVEIKDGYLNINTSDCAPDFYLAVANAFNVTRAEAKAAILKAFTKPVRKPRGKEKVTC